MSPVARRGKVVRYLIPLIVAGVLTGCASDVVVLNPRTGERATCPASPLNPWSQQESCIGQHMAQGWKRLEPQQR